MSWKKNAFSYLIWFVYTVLTGVGLMGIADLLCTKLELAFYWGAVFVFLYALLVWGIVLLLHRFAKGRLDAIYRKRELLLVLEGLAVVFLLAAGIMLRAGGAESAAQSSVYYEMAKVAAGQKIPQSVHGAVYFYVQMLHMVFGLLGNHFLAGIWFQIVLQLVAMVMVYFTMRRLAGAVAALVTFGFGMCAPYMVQSALVLSPETLYFLLLAVSGLGLAAAERASRGLRLPVFFLMGIVAAVCCYMDIMGMLLLFVALAMVFCRRNRESGTGGKIAAVSLCLLGAAFGFGSCILLDAILSWKTIPGVAQAWLHLYEPGGFRLPVVMEELGSVGDMLSTAGTWPVPSAGSAVEGILLLALMAFGVFSFWCDRRGERISVCVLSAGGIALASCYGIFTEEMPGFFVLYLLFAVLAGLGLGQCFYVPDGIGQAEGALEESGEAEKATEEDESAKELPDTKTMDKAFRQKEQMERTGESEADGIDWRERTKEIGVDEADSKTQSEYTADDSLSRQEAGEDVSQKEVRYLENPLPLPKKHVKRVLDYDVISAPEDDDFDFSVDEDDDFDI